jgi:hypothetical protein
VWVLLTKSVHYGVRWFGVFGLSMAPSECILLCGFRSMNAVRYLLVVLQVSMASCSRGLGSPLCCWQMSSPFWWYLCMYCCLNGRSRVVFCKYTISDIKLDTYIYYFMMHGTMNLKFSVNSLVIYLYLNCVIVCTTSLQNYS